MYPYSRGAISGGESFFTNHGGEMEIKILQYILYSILVICSCIRQQSVSPEHGYAQIGDNIHVASANSIFNNIDQEEIRYLIGNLSPNGQYYYSPGKDYLSLIFKSIEGTVVSEINLQQIENFEKAYHPKWVSGSQKISISVDQGEVTNLFYFYLSGRIQKITNLDIGEAIQSATSYDGGYIAFLLTNREEGHKIVIKNVDGNSEEIIESIPLSLSACGNPIWCNTQNILGYRVSHYEPENGTQEFWMYHVETKRKYQVFSGKSYSTYPLISFDDSFIAFRALGMLNLIDVEGDLIKTIDVPGGDFKQSNDLKYLCSHYTDIEPIRETVNFDQLFVTHLKSGKIRNLTPVDTMMFSSHFWFNDSTIVYY